MTITLNKTAAALAFIIGAMAIFAGGQVLLGKLPDYYVINWLPVYNYTAGILTVCIVTILLWVNHRLALPTALATFSVHALVMLILSTAYHDVVAVDSIRAMTVRLAAWSIILALMYTQARRNRTARA
jgi:drug/metabolite transporter (DMT)-like permease